MPTEPTPPPLPQPAIDALSRLLGEVPARLTRVALAGAAALAASKGFHWINPADPTLGLLLNAGITAALAAAGKAIRNKWPQWSWLPL